VTPYATYALPRVWGTVVCSLHPLFMLFTCIRLLFRTDTNDLTGGVRRGAGAMVISDSLALSSKRDRQDGGAACPPTAAADVSRRSCRDRPPAPGPAFAETGRPGSAACHIIISRSLPSAGCKGLLTYLY